MDFVKASVVLVLVDDVIGQGVSFPWLGEEMPPRFFWGGTFGLFAFRAYVGNKYPLMTRQEHFE
jgi:hypothetical protein